MPDGSDRLGFTERARLEVGRETGCEQAQEDQTGQRAGELRRRFHWCDCEFQGGGGGLLGVANHPEAREVVAPSALRTAIDRFLIRRCLKSPTR